VLVCWATGGMDCASMPDYRRAGLCLYTGLQEGWIMLVCWATEGMDCASIPDYSRAGLC
jgi:hypothetical protein